MSSAAMAMSSPATPSVTSCLELFGVRPCGRDPPGGVARHAVLVQSGGVPSQGAAMPHPVTLTTASGIPVEDNQNSLSAGPQGPLLLQDVHLIE